MALFSQRKGLKSFGKDLQLESIDEDLRNGLWTAIHLTYFDHYRNRNFYQLTKDVDALFVKCWLFYFKMPADQQPEAYDNIRHIRSYFFKTQWNESYDLIEFIVKNGGEPQQEPFRSACNRFLEMENAGYRLVGAEITPITSPVEIAAIDAALGSGLAGVEVHLTSALSLLSDRKNPDYRNSIKESISAVESICCVLSGDPKATLGSALKIVGSKAAIHPALEKAFGSLYGYTSDEKGIRHGLLEDKAQLSFTDAKFMLVACSAFVNYLIGKVADLGIRIGGK